MRLEANGITIHYLDWVEGSSRHLLLLHGLGSQAHTWDRFAEEASDSFRVVVPDLRGHGESSHAEDGYTADRFSGDLKALARHLNLPSFDLVGHSLGALIAIQSTWEYPDLVNHLVLVDGGPGMDAQAAREGGAADSFVRPLGFDTREEAKAWYGERYHGDSDERLDKRVQYGMKENWAGRWVPRHDPELYWILEGGARDVHEEDRFWEMLAAITCPVLVIHGKESTLLSPEVARRIADTVAQGTSLEIQGAGHSVQADAPEEFRDAVMGFLGNK